MKWTPWKLFWELVSKVGFGGEVRLEHVFGILPAGTVTLHEVFTHKPQLPTGNLTWIDIHAMSPAIPSGIIIESYIPKVFDKVGHFNIKRNDMIAFLQKLNIDLEPKTDETPVKAFSITQVDVAKNVEATPVDEYEQALDEVGFAGRKPKVVKHVTTEEVAGSLGETPWPEPEAPMSTFESKVAKKIRKPRTKKKGGK
jgi:hypothetical protein